MKRRSNSFSVYRAFYPATSSIQRMRVDHRCAHVAVPEQLLHSAYIVSLLDQVGREAVSERMAVTMLRYIGKEVADFLFSHV
jgi:hypothetical protein